jgi:hypothetical protein
MDEVSQEVMDEVMDEVSNEVRNEVSDKVRNEVSDEVCNKVWTEVWTEVFKEVNNEVFKEVNNEVRNEVRTEVWDEFWNEVSDKVENKSLLLKFIDICIKKNKITYIYPYLNGSFNSAYFAFYDYFSDIIKIKYSKKELYIIYRNTMKYGFIYPLKNICIVSKKPKLITKNGNGRLHCENDAALKYDGFELWRLNGVRVPKELVLTPAEKLDCKKWISEPNVEIRREFIRKIGTERLFNELDSKIIDNGVDHNGKPCELRSLDLGNEIIGIGFKFEHASLPGIYGIEFVPPECNTISKALKFRNGTKNKPLVLT